jgi:hypothetical protein
MRGKTILSGAAGIALGVVLVFLIGGTLVSAESSAMMTTSNGWFTYSECGKIGINILEQAVCAAALPGANVPQEAVYWQAYFDSAGNKLSGQHSYVLQFPAGGLPPNGAFWSVTMYYVNHTMVNNPINRFWVTGTSGLVSNANGSVDIYIQNIPPLDNETMNWLPAPTGDYLLFLRVYLPGAAILNGSYKVPPVIEVS